MRRAMLRGALVASIAAACFTGPCRASDLQHQLDSLDISRASLSDVTRAFGAPVRIVDDHGAPAPPDLSERAFYTVDYQGVAFTVRGDGKVYEVHVSTPGFAYRTLSLGSTLDDVLRVLGPPRKTTQTAPPSDESPGESALYEYSNELGVRARYTSNIEGIQLDLVDGRVTDITLAAPPFTHLDSVPDRGDVRWRDLTGLSAEGLGDKLSLLTYNLDTLWPDRQTTQEADSQLERGKDPGLHIRDLHAQGVTGAGVSVGIIDQPLPLDNPEYARQVAGYWTVGDLPATSMHGPAVASLLVGQTIGTAPGASLYYAAAPSWLQDARYYAEALERLIEADATLADDRKIRVVSVSGAPADGESGWRNGSLWMDAVREAAAVGILVIYIDASCIIAPGHFGADRQQVGAVSSGFAGQGRLNPSTISGRFVIPVDGRTVAEEYATGDFGYQYTGAGGSSWGPPYLAGLLAMGWQLCPAIDAWGLLDMLRSSAHRMSDGGLTPDPVAFVAAVREAAALQVPIPR